MIAGLLELGFGWADREWWMIRMVYPWSRLLAAGAEVDVGDDIGSQSGVDHGEKSLLVIGELGGPYCGTGTDEEDVASDRFGRAGGRGRLADDAGPKHDRAVWEKSFVDLVPMQGRVDSGAKAGKGGRFSIRRRHCI